MENLTNKLSYLLSGIYIPKNLRKNSKDLILHISDTPYQIYPNILKLITKLQPRYIIHTGNLVYNLRLSSNPKLINYYTKLSGEFIKALEDSSAERIYVCVGNEDNEFVIRRFANRTTVINKPESLFIRDLDLKIFHDPNMVIEDASDFNLFGKNSLHKTKKEHGKIFLNGYQNISIINSVTKEVFLLRYPWGIDSMRKRLKL